MYRNVKFISSVAQDTSRVGKANEISCWTREIISYFQTSMYCSVYYIRKIVIFPHKNRAALEYAALFVGQENYFLYNKQNNTWKFGNMKLFLVFNRISQSIVHSWDILINTISNFHTSMFYSLYYVYFYNATSLSYWKPYWAKRNLWRTKDNKLL